MINPCASPYRYEYRFVATQRKKTDESLHGCPHGAAETRRPQPRSLASAAMATQGKSCSPSPGEGAHMGLPHMMYEPSYPLFKRVLSGRIGSLLRCLQSGTARYVFHISSYRIAERLSHWAHSPDALPASAAGLARGLAVQPPQDTPMLAGGILRWAQGLPREPTEGDFARGEGRCGLGGGPTLARSGEAMG